MNKFEIDRNRLFEYLVDEYAPFYTIAELGLLTEAFIIHLKANESGLLRTGYSKNDFTRSKWFDWLLNYLYPTTEYSGEPFHSLHPRGRDLDPKDIRLIKSKRKKLFDVKIQLFGCVAEVLKTKNASKLWEKCLDILVSNLSGTDIQLCLRLDRFLVATRDEISPSTGEPRVRIDPFRGKLEIKTGEHFHAGLTAGGLTDMLDFAGHCEKELNIGAMAKTKQDFLLYPKDFSWSSYYENIGKPWQPNLEKTLDEFLELDNQENQFWPNYGERINEALQNEFYEEVTTKSRIKIQHKADFVASVKAFSDFQKAQLETTGQLAPLKLSASGKKVWQNKKVQSNISREAQRNAEKTAIVSALLTHHQFSDGSAPEELNINPAKQEDIGKMLNWRQDKVSKVIRRSFPQGFWNRYRQACKMEVLKGFLKKLDDDSIVIESISHRPLHPTENEKKESSQYD